MPAFTIELPNGKRLDVEADDENAALTGAQDWYKQNVSSKTDTSVTGALSQGASDVVSGVGKTIKEYIAPGAGKSVQDAGAKIADPKYKSASESFSRPEDGAENHVLGRDWSKLPHALLEQAPGMAADVGATLLAKRFGPLGQALAGGASYLLRSSGNEAQKRATGRTGDENAEPTATDKAIGLGSTAAQAAINQIGLSKIVNPAKVAVVGTAGALQAAGNVAKAAAAEGATNAAQDLVSQSAATAGTDKGLRVDTHSLGDSAIFGTAAGGAFSAPRGAKDAATAVRFRDADHGIATTMAANRVLDKVSKSSDLENPETAFKAVQGAIADNANELSSAAKSIRNPSPETANAISRAQAGEALSAKELAAVDAESNPALSSLVRQSTALKKLTEKGSYNPGNERFAGGLGERVRNLAASHKLTAIGATALPHIASNGFSGMDTLASAIPGMAEAAATGYAGYKGLKQVEKMMGIQSPARSFAEKFGDDSGTLRPTVPAGMPTSVPSVTPKNSLSTPQPWGPIPPKPERFKPDILEPGLQKIVDKIQNQKRQQFGREAAPLLRQLAEQSKPAPEAPGLDASAINEQIKGAMLMASARRKVAGQRQAEAEAAVSPMIEEQGGLEVVRNPAMGKRANELISAANALARLRRQPEPEEATDAPPIAPTDPQPQMPPQWDGPRPQPQSAPQPEPAQGGPQPTPEAPQEFTLPQSPYWHLDPKEASQAILKDAMSGPKDVRNPERYRASTERRLKGEEEIYNAISKDLSNVKERGAFHDYLSALWGSDAPEVVQQVREHMVAAFPHHEQMIRKHLSDEKIKALWTPPKTKKK